MDGKGIGNAIQGMMVAALIFGLAIGLIVGGIAMWLIPFLFRHVSVSLR